MTLSNANSIFHQALSRLNQGDTQGAEILLRKDALHPVESSPTCSGMLLSLLVMQNRFEDAQEVIQVIQDKHADNDQTNLALGLYYQATEQLDKAKDIYEKIITQSGDHPGAQWALADIHNVLGNWEKALWYATKAYHHDPSNLGFAESTIHLLKRTGKFELAQEVAYLACLYHPEEEDLFFEAFGVLFETDQIEQAVNLLNNFQLASPLSVGWHGIAIEATEGFERAANFFQEYFQQMGHHPGFLFLYATNRMRAGDTTETLEILEQVLTLDPGHQRALELKRSLQQPDLSADLNLARELFVDDDSMQNGFNLVSLLIRNQMIEEAETVLEELSDKDDFDSEAGLSYQLIASTLKGDYEDAQNKLKLVPLSLCKITATELRLSLQGLPEELDMLYKIEHRANLWEQHQALQKHYQKQEGSINSETSDEPATAEQELDSHNSKP